MLNGCLKMSVWRKKYFFSTLYINLMFSINSVHYNNEKMWIGTAYKPHEILLKKPLSQLWCYIHSKKIENTKKLKPYISLVCLYFGKLTWRLCLFVLLKNHLFYRTSNCFIILAVSLVCSVCFCLHNCFTDTWWDPEKLWCTYTVSLL